MASRFIVKSGSSGQYLASRQVEAHIVAHDEQTLLHGLDEIERFQREGYYLAGWISYEAATALNASLPVIASDDFPLLTLLATRDVETLSIEALSSMDKDDGISITPRINENAYQKNCSALLDYIHAGDVYQANYSFRCDLSEPVSPFQLFGELERAHPVPYAAYIEAKDWQVVSLSPELFLKRTGNELISLPMKGTMPRGKDFAEDEALRAALEQDAKNRAENIMIVDLMRNDLGRICETGSVRVPRKFEAERFHSLHQLTSEVRGDLRPGTSLKEILAATFPAGSITGAPKRRAMEIISELETDARKVYTGSVGLFEPGGDFQLNVAIRTLTCRGGKAELGIGSGVVANSEGQLEWQECLLKSDFLNFRQRHTEVFETIRWLDGYLWLPEHLERLANSATYFLMPCPMEDILARLSEAEQSFQRGSCYRVRLSLDRVGSVTLNPQLMEVSGWASDALRLKLSNTRVSSEDVYQYHKTDRREVYDAAYREAMAEGFDEVLFLNEKDELAEGAISNLFMEDEGDWMTPPLSAGLLPGIWRAQFARECGASEQTIGVSQLQAANAIRVGNSLRLTGHVGEIWYQGQRIWPATEQE